MGCVSVYEQLSQYTNKGTWNSHEKFLAQDYKLNTCRLTQIKKIFSVGFLLTHLEWRCWYSYACLTDKQLVNMQNITETIRWASESCTLDACASINVIECAAFFASFVKWAKWRLLCQTLLGYGNIASYVCKTHIIYFLPRIVFAIVNHPNIIWHWHIDTKD